MDSLYIHIPFCLSKCFYCSFTSFAHHRDIYSRYVDALLIELERKARQNSCDPLATIFIGGGTPTVLILEDLMRLICQIKRNFKLAEEVEFTIEANPEGVDLELLKALRRLGINRISFGVQSFNDSQLRQLGRLHSSEVAEKVIISANQAGFTNINVDLMYGLPGQTLNQHSNNLTKAFELPISHLSIYELTVEENTQFHRKLESGDLDLPGEEQLVLMDEITFARCDEAGFDRYEISNYAKDGLWCRHNLVYWKNEEYLGVGASAVSYVAGRRMKNIMAALEYCRKNERGESLIVQSERLAKEGSLRETVVMGLRMVGGVSTKRLFERYGVDLREYYGQLLTRLQDDGLIEWHEDHLLLTEYGLRFANQVMADLV